MNAKNQSRWSAREDNKLFKAFTMYENNWQKIQDEMARFNGKKTVYDIKDRIDKIVTSSVKGAWTPEED